MDLESQGDHFFQQLFVHCGEDPQREGLDKTPHRFFKAFEELTQGYQQNLTDVVNGALFKCSSQAPVVLKNVPFYSLCEHHLLPFLGQCQIAYVPNGCVLGLSKIYRIVDMFSRRLQMQERLTEQIGQALQQVTQAKAVHIEMIGEHLCVAMRGTSKRQSYMQTSYLYGQPILPQASVCEEKEATHTCLSLKTLEIPLFLGCYPEEQLVPTPVQVEIQLQNLEKVLQDDLKQTICYDTLIHFIQEHYFQQHFQLIEFACNQIYEGVHQFLREHHKKAHVCVKLIKTLKNSVLAESQYTISDF